MRYIFWVRWPASYDRKLYRRAQLNLHTIIIKIYFLFEITPSPLSTGQNTTHSHNNKKALHPAESFAWCVVLNNTCLPLLTTPFLHFAIIHVLQKLRRLIYTITSDYLCYLQQHVLGNIVSLVVLNWHCFVLYHVRVWTGLSWLTIEIVGGHLWVR